MFVFILIVYTKGEIGNKKSQDIIGIQGRLREKNNINYIMQKEQ